MRKSPSRSSKAATGVRKSRGLARPLAPIGAEFGQPERRAVVLADVAARLLVRQLDAELDAARNDGDLAGRDVENAELGMQRQRARAAARSAVRRRRRRKSGPSIERVGGVEVDRRRRSASCESPLPAIVTRPSTKSVGCVGIGSGSQRNWFGGVGTSSNGAATEPACCSTRSDTGLCIDRRPDAIEPGAPVQRPRRGERRAAELLGVQAERRLLRRVLARGSAPGTRLGGELVAEARHVLQIAVMSVGGRSLVMI